MTDILNKAIVLVLSPITKQNKDKAWSQLGTSGSGNHFVEFGLFTAHSKIKDLEAGIYVALLSHSGSRGTGASVCDHYSKLAFSQFPDLPGELKRLAWLSLDSQEGQEYWNAMELMGQYAAANHACIHRHIAENLGAQVLLDLENHHNFAWKEKHVVEGMEREVIVHRKGATPAGAGVLGIIPGSMASPGFVVSGKGNAESLNSASHGAGRAMSRKAANERFNWKDVNRLLRERGVTLISAGLDEVPMAYKNIRVVPDVMRLLSVEKWKEAGHWCLEHQAELDQQEAHGDGLKVIAGPSWKLRYEESSGQDSGKR